MTAPGSRHHRLRTAALALGLALTAVCGAADPTLIDAMDELSFSAPAEKGRVERARGHTGSAILFSFDNECKSAFAPGRSGGRPEWDAAAGFSFWVKGDGSKCLGGLEFIWGGDYSTRYALAFPIDSTEWRQVTVAWRDLVPELGKMSKLMDPKTGNPPSKLGPPWFGKWWYWKDYSPHSYTIDEFRLEPTIVADTRDLRPQGPPLARVQAKIKAGQPVTIVTMGDSLTDAAHWANQATNWQAILTKRVYESHRAVVTVVNPAMGGTELRHNLVVLPRWVADTPEPDLVTVFFGYNEWNAGMVSETFYEAQADAVDRIRRATNGKSDVLLMTSCPTLDTSEDYGRFADACRRAAADRNAGVADVYRAVRPLSEKEKPRLYANDRVHLAAPGHELVADTVLRALERVSR